MTASLATTQELFLIQSQTFDRVLARGLEGFPQPVDPQPTLFRAFYLSATEDIETRLPAVRLGLSNPIPDTLLCILPSPDGPPHRLARVFKHATNAGGPSQYKDRAGHLRPASMLVYVAISRGGYAWDSEGIQELPGLFITGNGTPSETWRILRIESDAFGSPLFTLVPLSSVSGFPPIDLSTIQDPLQQTEILSHYEELQRCVNSHAYRGVITRTKDVAEALIPLKADLPPSKNFSETLEKLREKLDTAKSTGISPPVQALTYHLAEKLRLLHQRTHPARPIRDARSITPEFALTVVQDLIEILRDLGYVKG